jgi:hypothetical protein
MAGLADVERFFERLFERPAARMFQPHIVAEALERQLDRAIEASRESRQRRSHVAARYRIRVDATRFGVDGENAALEMSLATHVRDYARQRGYLLPSPPVVTLEMVEHTAGAAIDVAAERPPRPMPEPAVAGASANADPPVEGTSVFRVAGPVPARASIVVSYPGQPVTKVSVRPGTMRIGRASDNDLSLPDERVSRHHGQIGVRHGTLIYRDLGSSNGSYVNGHRVTEIALGPGDVLQLGSSTLTIEPAD